MGRSPGSKSIIPIIVMVFFLSVFIVLGIMEFRFSKNLLADFENNIKQIALNKTTLFLNDIKAVSENAAQKAAEQDQNVENLLKLISTYDYRITNVYLVGSGGEVGSALVAKNSYQHMNSLVSEELREKIRDPNKERIIISGVHIDASHLKVISAVIPLSGIDASYKALVIDFSIEQYQEEMMQEFFSESYKVAVFDSNDYPVYWPFDKENLDGFKKHQAKFYDNSRQYNVISSETGQPKWRLYFFFAENNYETIRTIAILLLVFALYCCLYQLLVELWGVNSARTYFENIDFAVLNKINEGVIISNNAGRIIFANNAAHEIFAERKSSLTAIDLRDIMRHTEDSGAEKENPCMLTLKMSDKLLESIHSPIIKKGKKLGSLTVIRVNVKEERTFRIVLDKLIEVIPEGVIYIDRKHAVSAANLMARCYLGNLDKGASIDVVNPALADFIYGSIGSRSVKRTELSSHDLLCDIAPVFDDDGVYAGTLVVLFNDLGKKEYSGRNL